MKGFRAIGGTVSDVSRQGPPILDYLSASGIVGFLHDQFTGVQNSESKPPNTSDLIKGLRPSGFRFYFFWGSGPCGGHAHALLR